MIASEIIVITNKTEGTIYNQCKSTQPQVNEGFFNGEVNARIVYS